MKEQPSLYIEINVADINGMSGQELAEYLSARLAEVEPEVLDFVKRYRELLIATDDIGVCSPEIYVPIVMLLDNVNLQEIRYWQTLSMQLPPGEGVGKITKPIYGGWLDIRDAAIEHELMGLPRTIFLVPDESDDKRLLDYLSQ
jgi:hypothetical protein